MSWRYKAEKKYQQQNNKVLPKSNAYAGKKNKLFLIFGKAKRRFSEVTKACYMVNRFLNVGRKYQRKVIVK